MLHYNTDVKKHSMMNQITYLFINSTLKTLKLYVTHTKTKYCAIKVIHYINTAINIA